MGFADREFVNAKVYDKGVAVTPSDTVDLTGAPWTLIHCGTAGDVVVDVWHGATNLTVAGNSTGANIPISVKRIRATGTTATPIVVFQKALLAGQGQTT